MVKGYAEAVDKFDYTRYPLLARLIILPIVIPGMYLVWLLAVLIATPIYVIDSLIAITWMSWKIVKRNLR